LKKSESFGGSDFSFYPCCTATEYADCRHSGRCIAPVLQSFVLLTAKKTLKIWQLGEKAVPLQPLLPQNGEQEAEQAMAPGIINLIKT